MNSQIAALDMLYRNLRFTQLVHEGEAYLSKLTSTLLKIVNIGLIASILLLQLLQSSRSSRDFTGASIALAVVGVALQAFQLSFNFENKHNLHRETAKNAVSLKNSLLLLKADLQSSARMTDELLARRDGTVEEINSLYTSAPQTGWLAKLVAGVQYRKDEVD